MARKKSDKRLRTVVAYSRMTPEEYADVQDKAAASGNTVSAFIRAASLGRKLRNRQDRLNVAALVDMAAELNRLGGLQKHLFYEGGKSNRAEYSDVLAAIKKATDALTVAVHRLGPDADEADAED
ncbi:plasmid mobilization protein MobA [Achromobacter dolens]|uniref:plasmid mobilization protein MobA n=1 Tax=Achromobacter dolens TaxID=1287738 RepID=UPI003555E4F8